jgi:hypothetical protein
MRSQITIMTARRLFYVLLTVAGLQSAAHAENVPNVSYRTIIIEGVDILSAGGRPEQADDLVVTWLSYVITHVPGPDHGVR